MSIYAEQQTEWIISNNLVNKGWNIDGDSPLKNVFFQIPKIEEQRKKLKGKRPDYILYQTGTQNPIAIIEAKKGGVDLQPALKQATEYAEALQVPLVFAMNGSYCETRFVPNGQSLIMDNEEVRELIREADALKFLQENTNRIFTVPEEVIVSREELIRIFKDLNNTLRAEGLRAGIERFSEFSNILFLKLLSENEKESYWNFIKGLPDNRLITTINYSVIKEIENKYGGNVFTELSIKNPKTLRKIIERIDPLKLGTIDTDVKGDAFEYFLKKTTSTDNDLGEYFTPRHIVKTIINIADPKFKEKVYDPFCGTGGFLTEAFNYIRDNNIIEGKSDSDRLKGQTLFGGEITTTARIAKMNMILHGDGHSGITQIDSLQNPKDKEYDVIVTNIPFSQKTEYGDYYYNGIAKKNGDAVCALHCLRSLKEGGRMALVVPEGFLFRKDISNVREFLLSKAKLQSVISLPQGVFLPYATVKTDILYFTDAHKINKQKSYWYFDVKNDGYSLDAHRRQMNGKSDLHRVSESDFKRVEKDNSYINNMIEIGFELIDLEKVRINNYNFVGSAYREIIRGGKFNFVKIGEILKFIRGFSYKSDILSESGIPMYNLKSVKKDFIVNYDFKFIKTNTEINKKHNCTSGDLLMAITDLTPTSEIIGRTVVVKDDGIFSMDLAKLHIIDESIVSNKYLHYIFNSEEFLRDAKKFSIGNTVKHLKIENVLSIQIPLPPIDIQLKIVSDAEEKEREIEELKEKIFMAKKDINANIHDIWISE